MRANRGRLGPLLTLIVCLRDGHALLSNGSQYWLQSRRLSRPDAEPPKSDVVLPKLHAPTIPPVQGPITAWTAATFLWLHPNAARCSRWSYDAFKLPPTIFRYVANLSPYISSRLSFFSFFFSFVLLLRLVPYTFTFPLRGPSVSSSYAGSKSRILYLRLRVDGYQYPLQDALVCPGGLQHGSSRWIAPMIVLTGFWLYEAPPIVCFVLYQQGKGAFRVASR